MRYTFRSASVRSLQRDAGDCGCASAVKWSGVQWSGVVKDLAEVSEGESSECPREESARARAWKTGLETRRGLLHGFDKSLRIWPRVCRCGGTLVVGRSTAVRTVYCVLCTVCSQRGPACSFGWASFKSCCVPDCLCAPGCSGRRSVAEVTGHGVHILRCCSDFRRWHSGSLEHDGDGDGGAMANKWCRSRCAAHEAGATV